MILLVYQWNSNLCNKWLSKIHQKWTTVALLNYEVLYESNDIPGGWCALAVHCTPVTHHALPSFFCISSIISYFGHCVCIIWKRGILLMKDFIIVLILIMKLNIEILIIFHELCKNWPLHCISLGLVFRVNLILLHIHISQHFLYYVISTLWRISFLGELLGKCMSSSLNLSAAALNTFTSINRSTRCSP